VRALRYVVVILWAASWSNPAVGQVPFFQHYPLLKKNELVHVNVIFQDKRGFVWCGTSKGLFKFDGINAQWHHAIDSLPDENITALAEDSLGRIWMGHKNGQLTYLDGVVITKFNPAEGNATQEVSDIIFDKRGNLWFSTLNDGLYYFRQDRLYRIDEEEGLPDLFVYDIEEDQKGNIWAGTDGGVVICSLSEGKLSMHSYDYSKGLPDNIVKKIISADDGRIWMATEDAGIIIMDPSTGKFKPLLQDGWNYGVITDFLFTDNQVWISSLQTGIVVVDRTSLSVKVYNARSGAGFSSIEVLMRDWEGNIWAATKTDVLRSRGDHVELISSLEPLTDINTIAVAIDRQNNIWFSTREGLFRRKSDKAGNISIDKILDRSPYQKYTVISLYVDDVGMVWAGLYGEGVVRIDPVTGATRYLNKELRNGNVLGITGSQSVVWLATLGGAVRIQGAGDKLDIKNFGSLDGLSSDYIYQVLVDSRGRAWFATDGRGVDMLDEQGFHHYQEGLRSKVVYSIAEDRDHRIWVNVQGDGLYRLSGNVFEAFDPTNKRLRDNNISCFATTSGGSLFVMHDFGIDVYDPATDRVRYLGEESGIRNRKPNLNAVAKDGRNNIFAGTDGGIVKYSDGGTQSTVSPRPVIEGMEVMNKLTAPGEELSFSYDRNNITIHFLGLWYQNPPALNYLYQLKNYDVQWLPTKNHSVTYSSLPPGDYVFQVKTSDTEDFRNAAAATIGFSINPPFWRTVWFYGFSIVATLLAIYFIIKYRERSLYRDKQILEASVQERTLEIKRKNEEIQAQAKEIRDINQNLEGLVRERTHQLEAKNRALEEYAFINAHELRAPVASILGLINLMRSIELKEDEKIYLKHLETSAEKLDSVVREIGQAIEKGGIPER
jgi:ligand-binding sensor domain-containing protein